MVQSEDCLGAVALLPFQEIQNIFLRVCVVVFLPNNIIVSCSFQSKRISWVSFNSLKIREAETPYNVLTLEVNNCVPRSGKEINKNL